MPVLTWIGKDKVVNHDKELPFRVLKPVKELSVGENSENLLIEGDNLEALKALMPFYYGKIKCVFIDPPYNTGNQTWVYNDKVSSPQIKSWFNKVVGAEGEDLCRHDKWLCMMYPRLKLIKDLLTEDGAIFIAIDDNELHNLRQVMDEIFGETNFVVNIVWEKVHTRKNSAKYFSYNHDYVVCFAKNKELWKRNFVPREGTIAYKNPDNDPKGPWKLDPIYANNPYALEYKITKPDGTVLSRPEGRYWRFSEKTIQEKIKNNEVLWGKGNSYPMVKRYLSEVQEGLVPVTIFTREFAGDTAFSSAELRAIFNQDKIFEYPKPSKLIKRILQIATTKNDIVLDSFAGSGTTGHAVLELNKEDGGNRKFILVELEKEIARKVTAKRLETVIKGFDGALFPEGTGQGFQYLDLNGELYNQSGFVNPDAKYEDMAAYIYFSETKNYLDIPSIKNPYIGSQGSMHYFLFFEGKGNNVLNEKTLKRTEGHNGNKVIYADKCLLDEEYLTKKGIIFKQIPYELKKY